MELILNLAARFIDNKFKGASDNFTIVNLYMKSFLAIFLGVAAGVKVTCNPCGAAPTCAGVPQASQLRCPAVGNGSGGRGYGSISSRSKGQS
jgi:hypothetical protein